MWELIGKLAVLLVLGRLLWSLIKGLYGSFIASILHLNLNIKKTGEWAVVTGATDGIGKAFAFELARLGFKVVLVSRTPFKLQNVAAEIKSQHGVETRIIDVDFTRTDIYKRLEDELSNLDIGVLVNNVGMSYDHPEFFIEIDNCAQTCERLINCNIRSLTEMTRIVLPGMAQRHRGLVINLSSLSSTIPAPLLAVYGATKAYVSSLSDSLNVEYKGKGVQFQCLLPGYVVSNMSKVRRPTIMIPSPTAYVRSVLKTSGVESNTAAYYMHKIQIYFIEIAKSYLPGFVLQNIVFHQLSSFRQRAHRKKQKENNKTE